MVESDTVYDNPDVEIAAILTLHCLFKFVFNALNIRVLAEVHIDKAYQI